MRPTLAYTVLRLLVLLVAWIALYLAGARGLLLPLLAIVISGVVSFILLSRHRDAMSAAITRRLDRARERLAAGTTAEDEDPD
jgi:hypothetical protein